jgi:hypothetical protein
MRRAAALIMLLAAPALFGATPPMARRAVVENNASCDIGTYPAATLLLPYFEVDYNAPATEAVNTLFTVINTSKYPAIVRVTLWTDYGFPASWFPMFLTGYAAESVSMYSIFGRGFYPVTTSWVPTGAMSADNKANPNFYPETWCERTGGSMQPETLKRLRAMFTDGTRDTGCAIGGKHAMATGYATVDVVNNCGIDSPLSPTYWKETILFDNILTGEYERINPNETTGNYAGGNPLVHIRAVPDGGKAGSTPAASLPYTFYDRYTPRDARHIDRRQPLPSTFIARYIQGGRGDFRTRFAIWREGLVGPDSDECAYAKNAAIPAPTASIVRFDEHENATVIPADAVAGSTAASVAIASDSPLFAPMATGDLAGWFWLTLDNGAGRRAGSPYSSPRPSQNWVVVQMYAEGRYAVDFDASSLANGCTVAPPPAP